MVHRVRVLEFTRNSDVYAFRPNLAPQFKKGPTHTESRKILCPGAEGPSAFLLDVVRAAKLYGSCVALLSGRSGI